MKKKTKKWIKKYWSELMLIIGLTIGILFILIGFNII